MSEAVGGKRPGDRGAVIGAAASAAGAGAFAAILGTCCVAPWAVGLIGVAGAVALARLTFLTPFLVAGSIALLGLAFYFAYRPGPVCAEDACETTTRRRRRWIAWLGALVVAATLAITLLPYL
jgi:hypothetical protein